MKKIVIDLLGGDNGLEPLLQGAVDTLIKNPEIGVVLAGPEQEILQGIRNYVSSSASDSSSLSMDDIMSRIEILDTDDYIRNDEPATSIFTGRENSTLGLSLARLKDDADCIGYLSAGNTGAILVGSTFRLGLTKGLKTPALSSSLLANNGKHFCLVDCGANVNCTAKDLATFALLGNAFAKAMYHIEEPRIALLSVGREEGKGNPLIIEAYQLIKELPIHFIGNAEGYDPINGYADVIVADGYAGNLLLKNIEAVGKTAMKVIENKKITASPSEKQLCDELLAELYLMFDMNTQGGATFLGTKKPIIKMHGCAVRETVAACADQLLTLHAAGFDRYIADAYYTGSEP